MPDADVTAFPVLFQFDLSSSIAHIILNRPRSLNAINVDLLTSLVDALKNALNAKVCIISGSGTSFCSGEDLKETLAPHSDGRDPSELRLSLLKLQDLTRLTAGTETVFISCVQGWAIGGGAEIALAADLVVAGPDAKFKFPEIIHGHAPTCGISARLPQIIGLQQAKRLLLLGDTLSAAVALTMNLVTEVVDEPLARSLALASELSKRSKRSLGSIKRGLELATFPNSESVLQWEMDATSWCMSDDCAYNAFESFRNRKQPHCNNVVVSTKTIQSSGGYSLYKQEDDMIQWLLAAANEDGEKTFLRFGEVDVSFAKFKDDVSHLADGLLMEGVQPYDVVAGMMFNSKDMVCAWFATMWIGAIWAPLNTEFRGTVLDRALALVSPKIFIVEHEFLSMIPCSRSIKVFVHGQSVASGALFESLIVPTTSEPVDVAPERTACLLLTSGTTGPSKACELSHKYFTTVVDDIIDWLGLKPDDVLFCPFPLYHMDATALTVVPALRLRATAAIVRKFSASRWWDEIRLAKATVADFMGATLCILFKAPLTAKDADNPLRLMWGVPVPTWAEEFEERFGLQILECYGATESGLPVIQRAENPRVVGSCGVVQSSVELKIVGDSGAMVEPGQIGEIIIRHQPYRRFTGYYKNQEATAQALKDGWFYTGDLARVDSEGNLFFIGRKKQTIRRRGENISSFEIEEALLLHPDILECAAYGVPSDLTEEDVKVSIVKRTGVSLSAQNVYDFAIDKMPRFSVPRYIEFVVELPRTPTGKIETFRLQEMWKSGNRSAVVDFDRSYVTSHILVLDYSVLTWIQILLTQLITWFIPSPLRLWK
ncbi:acetyl-CoA synthetase-like protein [Rickenella mellea]|uniref:Acetyl-CoA synthetase-like protein n=1 Tax=Rickenella mellea TaxID=50990 RepID=A0A4Y7QE85_9AGAM|nr:acetyl-CoA synthetase-like protein [Rickenella mellea]